MNLELNPMLILFEDSFNNGKKEDLRKISDTMDDNSNKNRCTVMPRICNMSAICGDIWTHRTCKDITRVKSFFYKEYLPLVTTMCFCYSGFIFVNEEKISM